MTGKHYLLDTNAIIALLTGDIKLLDIVSSADWIGISVINQIEFLVFPGLLQSDKDLFTEFLKRIEIIDLSSMDNWLIEKIINVRRQYGLKIPDAVIAATTMKKDAILLTTDKDFFKVKELKTIVWVDK